MGLYGNYISESYNIYNEKVSSTSSDFYIDIKNKKYHVYNNDGFSKDEVEELIDDITKEIEKLLKDEKKIIDKVYKLYKKDYGENYEKDKKKDYIDSFELLKPDFYPGKFNIGIFLSSLNQFYTIYHNGNIIEKQTYIY